MSSAVPMAAQHGDMWGSSVFVIMITLIAIPLISAIRTLYFHPLSKIPGPKTWIVSRLPFIRHLLKGSVVQQLDRIHDKYGGIVRTGPDEVSFAVPEAWHDIYEARPGQQAVLKDEVWYTAPNDMPQNIVTTNDAKVHKQMRTALNNSFTADAVRDQRPIIEGAADLLVQQLQSIARTSGNINITEWVNFFTVDIIGDLAFGESFGCMQNSDYHPWVRTLYNFLKGMIFAATTRFYPPMDKIMMKVLPAAMMEAQRQHTAFANAQIDKRLENDVARPDLMTPFLKNNKNFQLMSKGEIQSTFALLIVAGSETTATSLLGTINYLASAPSTRHKLAAELHATFASNADINLEALTSNPIPYLEATIHEGLRICNPVPGGLPRIVPPAGGMYAGVFLPGGTRVTVRPHAMNHSDKYFHRANEFLPERWLPEDDRPEGFAQDVRSASRPFSAGPTGCIGQPLGWAELRLFLARLVFNFEIEAVPGRRVEWEGLRQTMVVEKAPVDLRLMLRK